MPAQSPANVRRKSSAQPKEDSAQRLNFASQSAHRGPAPVQDRIKNWQKQCGSAGIAHDAAAVESDSDTGGAREDGDKEESGDNSGSPMRNRYRGDVRKPRAKQETPKKRLVSDGHWVKKIPKPPPPPPEKEKYEVVLVRPSTKRKANGEEKPYVEEEVVVRTPESPVKKSPTKNKEPVKPPATPRKPSAIDAWLVNVEEAPAQESKTRSRHSRSAEEDENGSDAPRQRDSKQRKPSESAISRTKGDESTPNRPKSSSVNKRPHNSPSDTRTPEERAAELVANRRASDVREKWRTSSSPAAPPLSFQRKSPRLSPAEDVPPPKAQPRPKTPDPEPLPERAAPRRSVRREQSASREKSEPIAKEPDNEKVERPDVELRRLRRSMKERKAEPKSAPVSPTPGAEVPHDAELRRLQRSLKERKSAYTPTTPSNEPEGIPETVASEPAEQSTPRPPSEQKDEAPKSSHSSSTRRKGSQAPLDTWPPAEQATVAPPPPKVFGSRIDAWLSHTPDPFSDNGSSSSAPSRTETGSDVSSSYLGSSYFSSTASDSITPSEAISNVANRQERERRRQRLRALHNPPITTKVRIDDRAAKKSPRTPERVQKIDPEIEVECASNSSASTLKRRGAKRNSPSPTKERMQPLVEESKALAFCAPPPPSNDLTSLQDDATNSTVSSSVEGPPDPPEHGAGIRRGAVPFKRPFPTTGKRLSTIASVETFATKTQNALPSHAVGSEIASAIQERIDGKDAAASVVSSSSTLRAKNASLRRKMTTHADLMSVLSLPDQKSSRSKTVVSARSIRTNRSKLATATMKDLMNELASDEKKYVRELRTLVDGVIPVLLSCVFSKADSAVAAGLFYSRADGRDEAATTRPIAEMGVALERLKSMHKRIPMDNEDSLLSWAQNAQKLYADYAKAWRLGFQDVVVNLAHADGSKDADCEEFLPQNEDGDVVDANGERVDVAFLLKRPLVRIKYLAKTFKGINILKPSERAASTADAYQELVILARQRTNEERARLEDEAAASIDPTRARDPKTLGPLAGVHINQHRFVKARDYFDMHMLHSSGQEIDCRIELLMRDATRAEQAEGAAGDMLICEVDSTGRWLFLPPIQRDCISSRKGKGTGELVLMVRGTDSTGQDWHELLSMKASDDEAALEWIQMIGMTPMPPTLSRARSFVSQARRPPSSHAGSSAVSSYVSTDTVSTPPPRSRTPSPRQLQVPIGEKARSSSKRWSVAAPKGQRRSLSPVSPITPPSDERHSSSRSRRRSGHDDTPTRRTSAEKRQRPPRRLSDERDEYESDSPFKGLKEAFKSLAGGNALKRSKAKRVSRNMSSSPAEYRAKHSPDALRDLHREEQDLQDAPVLRTSASAPVTPGAKSEKSKGFSVWYPPSRDNSSDSEEDVGNDEDRMPTKLSKSRPTLERRASSVPKMDLPAIPKLRKGEKPRDKPEVPSTPVKKSTGSSSIQEQANQAPASAPSKLQKDVPARYRNKSRSPERSPESENPPTPPPHRNSVSLPFRSSPATQLAATPTSGRHRRTSSPLKHEYQPSSASESSTESEDSASDEDISSSESDVDDDDVPLALISRISKQAANPPTPPETVFSPPNSGTIGPSQSASQAPYRTVPPTTTQAQKAIASVFSWSDKNFWQPLHPDECSIVISAGLIEVFEMTAAHSFDKPDGGDASESPKDASKGSLKPLVGFELTPCVPLMKGAAVDITIRSPPTENSTLVDVGKNILLRSRNLEECDSLYHWINWARCNNPTWNALENARGRNLENTWAAAMERRNSQRGNGRAGGSSWWEFGGSKRSRSYRASSTRAASTSAMSKSSVMSSSSLVSAMRRFTNGNRLFDVAKSSVSWRHSTGSTGNSFDSLSGGSGGSTPPLGGKASKRTSTMGMPGGQSLPPGTIASFETRLYIKASSKWLELGSSRMQIMQPAPQSAPPTPGYRPSTANAENSASPNQTPKAPASAAPSSNTNSSGGSANSAPAALASSGARDQKRVLILGKKRGEVMLDVTLGESAFERVARVGIAVNVITRTEEPTVAAKGGVAGVMVKTYMIQFKDAAITSYAFSLLGKLRY